MIMQSVQVGKTKSAPALISLSQLQTTETAPATVLLLVPSSTKVRSRSSNFISRTRPPGSRAVAPRHD